MAPRTARAVDGHRRLDTRTPRLVPRAGLWPFGVKSAGGQVDERGGDVLGGS
jgi:hypothetical protein